MSIIIAADYCNKVIVMSDGRRSAIEENGETIILDEDCKKIIRFSDKLCIAYAGLADNCKSVIDGVAKILSDLTSVEQYTSAIINWIQENVDYKHTDFNAQFIIAGCNSFGRLKINAIRCYNHVLSHERNNLLDEGKFTVCSSLDPTDDFITPIMQQQDKPLIDRMMTAVREASKRNQTINDHISYETLTV